MPIAADHAVDLRAPAAWSARPDVEQAAWMSAPLATLPRVQEVVGEIDLLLLPASRSQLDAAAVAADAGTPWLAADSGLLTVATTRNAIAVVALALRQTGNHGLSRRHPLRRFHRDLPCGRVHTLQDDSALVAAGRAALQS